jgi:hypothetical protein
MLLSGVFKASEFNAFLSQAFELCGGMPAVVFCYLKIGKSKDDMSGVRLCWEPKSKVFDSLFFSSRLLVWHLGCVRL